MVHENKLKAVLLDWAGTTMDYGCYAPAVVFMDVFSQEGVPIRIEEAREPMGAHKRVHIQKITWIPTVRERWKGQHGQYPTEDDVDRMFEAFVPKQLACLAQYADLIPGALEAVAEMRGRGLKIGSTTGYTGEMMGILLEEAAKRGYEPDSSVCATDVPYARPYPFMCLQNAVNLGIEDNSGIVKVGDTLPDLDEGLRAGMWTIGLALTGNEMGLNAQEVEELKNSDSAGFEARLSKAYDRMTRRTVWTTYGGSHALKKAHYVVDGIWDVPPLLDKINERLASGERP